MLRAKENISPTKELKERIDKIIESHGNDHTQLVGILLEVQELDELHYVPEPVAYYVSEKLSIPVVRVFECLSFYARLSSEPRAKYPIQVCDSVACRVNGSAVLLDTMKDFLGIDIGETTYDGRFTIERVSCFGACDAAPAVRINGKVYGNLDTPEKVKSLLKEML